MFGLRLLLMRLFVFFFNSNGIIYNVLEFEKNSIYLPDADLLSLCEQFLFVFHHLCAIRSGSENHFASEYIFFQNFHIGRGLVAVGL